MALPASSQTGAVVAFPRADLRALLGTALKRHRLPESLAAALVREAAKFPKSASMRRWPSRWTSA